MSGLLGDAPDYNAQPLSATDQQSFYNDQDSNKYSADQVTKGIGENLATMPTDSLSQGNDTFSSSALQARAQKSFGQHLQGLGFKAEMSQTANLQRQRLQNYDFAKQVQGIVQHVNERRRLAEVNKIAARNQVIGGIIGIGGGIAGGMIGGPMGAAAGMQLGKIIPGQNMSKMSPRSNFTGGIAGNNDDISAEENELGGGFS